MGMRQALQVILCALFALLVGRSLLRAWKTGTISSRGWTFERGASPIGFWFMAVSHLIILVGSLALAMHILGLIGDHPTSITMPLPNSH
jgi:hypothetical protein